MYSGSAPRGARAARASSERLAGLGDHVGRPGAVAGRVLADDDHRLRERRVLRERRLDLAELDAVAAELHLMVDAAEVLELPSAQAAARSPVR